MKICFALLFLIGISSAVPFPPPETLKWPHHEHHVPAQKQQQRIVNQVVVSAIDPKMATVEDYNKVEQDALKLQKSLTDLQMSKESVALAAQVASVQNNRTQDALNRLRASMADLRVRLSIDIDRAQNLTEAQIEKIRVSSQINLDKMKASIDAMKNDTDLKAQRLKAFAAQTAQEAKFETATAVLPAQIDAMRASNQANLNKMKESIDTMKSETDYKADRLKAIAEKTAQDAKYETATAMLSAVKVVPVVKPRLIDTPATLHDKKKPLVQQKHENVTVVGESPKQSVVKVPAAAGQLVVNNTVQAGKSLGNAPIAAPAVQATKGGGVSLKDAIVGRKVNDLSAHPGPVVIPNEHHDGKVITQV